MAMSEKVNSLWEQIRDLDPVELRELHDRIRRERGEEEPGATGVREPRKPRPPTDEAGAVVEPEHELRTDELPAASTRPYDYESEGLGGT
jgi:hypothetical protein